MPALLALDTELVLRKSRSTRVLSLNDFYVAYQQTALQPGEFVERILIPLPVPDSSLQSYKVSKRFDQDISAVCGAFRIRLDGDKVVEVRVAYGGMAEVPARASGCEKAILQSGWNDASIEAAMNALDEDFAPITDMRSSGDYRRLVCRNLLKRFYLETTGAASERVYAYGR
jgi:xanthine dehydrogenase small subunit